MTTGDPVEEAKMIRTLLAAALLLAVPLAGLGGEEEFDEDAREEREERDGDDEDRVWERFEKRVSFEFADTPLADALKFLRMTGRINIVLHRDVRAKLGKEPVTIALKNVRLMSAIRALSASLGLEARVIEGGIVLLKFPPPDADKTVGKIEVDLGPVSMELDLRLGDLPQEHRREIVARALRQIHRETELRERKLDRAHRDIEAKERARHKKLRKPREDDEGKEQKRVDEAF